MICWCTHRLEDHNGNGYCDKCNCYTYKHRALSTSVHLVEARAQHDWRATHNPHQAADDLAQTLLDVAGDAMANDLPRWRVAAVVRDLVRKLDGLEDKMRGEVAR